jgi:outer membrane biosynthesis protein TonB
MTSTRPRTPAPAVRPDLRPGAGPKHAPRVPFALLVGGLVIGGMCALLALNTASAANELARHQIAGKDSDVSGQLEQVRNQVAASAAPGSLGQAATALGMVPAGAPAFLKIGADGKVVLLGSPAPATAPPPPPPAPVVHKPTPTKKATPTKAKTKTKAKTAKKTTKKKPSTPTPTPTPTTTLPGGTR